MAAINFVYAGRVYADESKTNVLGYWGISLALNCHFVYTPNMLNEHTIKEFEKAGHELDYVRHKPNNQIYRLSCSEHTDIVFTQKGTFSLVAKTMKIPHPNLKVITPTWRYLYNTGFSVGAIAKYLSSISLLTTGDTTKLFHPGSDIPNYAPLMPVSSGNRKRLITLSIDTDLDRVIVPYGVTSVLMLSGSVKELILSETVELVRQYPYRHPYIGRVQVTSQYFPQNVLCFDNQSCGGAASNGELSTQCTDLLLLDNVYFDKVNTTGEVIKTNMEHPASDQFSGSIHSRVALQVQKPRGLVI